MRILSFFRGIFVLLKKDLRLYFKHILSMLLLLALLAAGSALALIAALSGSLKDKDNRLCMAIFDKEPSSIANQAIDIVSHTESVAAIFTVEICDSEKEVRDGMKSGIYDAAIIFEEGYFSKILNGDDAGVCILISDKLNSAGEMVEHFAVSGEKLIKIAESGIEAAYARLREEYSIAKSSDIISPVQIDYAFEIFGMATEVFDVEKVPYASNGVDTAGHYILCFAAFLLGICEVLFFPYTAGDCAFSMLRRIKSYRITNAAIVIEKAIIPFLIRLGLLGVIVGFTEAEPTPEAVFYALLCVLLTSLLFSAISVLLSQSTLGISVIFALCSASLVLSGGLIPSAMLPYEMVQMGEFTPLGLCKNMLAPLALGHASPSAVVMLAAFTALAVYAACVYLGHICEKGGGER